MRCRKAESERVQRSMAGKTPGSEIPVRRLKARSAKLKASQLAVCRSLSKDAPISPGPARQRAPRPGRDPRRATGRGEAGASLVRTSVAGAAPPPARGPPRRRRAPPAAAAVTPGPHITVFNHEKKEHRAKRGCQRRVFFAICLLQA